MTLTATLPVETSYAIPEPQILCVIPARGGSKGFPGKNIALLSGIPLLAHTIQHALESNVINIGPYVSTDDEEIAKVAKDYGAEVIMRPRALSGDYAPSEWALLHVMEEIAADPEYIVMLQCTSPIRKSWHITEAFHHLLDSGADSLLSVVAAPRFIWEGVPGDARPINYNFRARPMRQVAGCGWAENGSIYITKRHVLEQTGNRLGGKIAMYEQGYFSQFEIDQHDDLDLCEWILEREP